jgi:hypothetical protein
MLQRGGISFNSHGIQETDRTTITADAYDDMFDPSWFYAVSEPPQNRTLIRWRGNRPHGDLTDLSQHLAGALRNKVRTGTTKTVLLQVHCPIWDHVYVQESRLKRTKRYLEDKKCVLFSQLKPIMIPKAPGFDLQVDFDHLYQRWNLLGQSRGGTVPYQVYDRLLGGAEIGRRRNACGALRACFSVDP